MITIILISSFFLFKLQIYIQSLDFYKTEQKWEKNNLTRLGGKKKKKNRTSNISLDRQTQISRPCVYSCCLNTGVGVQSRDMAVKK